jgi:hypothetical protein
MKNRFISSTCLAFFRAILIPLLAFGTPVFSSFGENRTDSNDGEEVTHVRNESEIQQLISRVLEIKGIDRSTLDPEERESLKSELRLIKSDLQKSAREQKTNRLGGVYISVGGIIIILLILLIIL